MHYTYITTNRFNGKKYIGQRKLPSNKTLNTDEYLGSGTSLIYAVKKYGKDCFSKEVISTHKTQKGADEKEIELINYYDAVNSDMYYNISPGGQFGRSEDHSEAVSKYMSEYYNDDDNYTNARIKVNRARIRKGLKPTYYTIAERDINKLRKSFTKAYDKKQSEYKKRVKRIANPFIVKENRINSGIKSWESNRDGRIESMRKAWDKRKDDCNGVIFDDDYKRKLSIAKLEKSGNYVGLYLIENGCVSCAWIRKPLSKLIYTDYKDYQNYVKQAEKVVKMIVERGICINFKTLTELVNKTRVFKGKRPQS